MDQKEEEKLVMAMFRKSYSEFPKGRLIPSESPDFILKTGRHQSIGIELTRISDLSAELHAEIRMAIIRKIEKHLLYQTKVFNEIWLLIYADDLQGLISKDGTIEVDIDERNPFQKTFILDLFSGRHYQVTVI
ncbi:MAG: hypothetical protein KDC05_16035, partial [Bacteroidales bacterium]|nr:hypothetical protein [Bacteroidales bacterium]